MKIQEKVNISKIIKKLLIEISNEIIIKKLSFARNKVRFKGYNQHIVFDFDITDDYVKIISETRCYKVQLSSATFVKDFVLLLITSINCELERYNDRKEYETLVPSMFSNSRLDSYNEIISRLNNLKTDCIKYMENTNI